MGFKEDIKKFYCIGINYKKTDINTRGQFAIDTTKYALLLQQAQLLNIKEIFVLSTCNRTEIYTLTTVAPEIIVQLLAKVTEGDIQLLSQLCYIKKGKEAIQHIFAVGCGLDSQILGDYEIVGQMKIAVKFAKEHNTIGAFIERLFNTVLHCSKTIKNTTQLSSGTVSVSFAAIQYIKQNLGELYNKKVVVIGLGKIGRNTCNNLTDYLKATDIVLINRTTETAQQLATELNVMYDVYDNMLAQIQEAAVVIVATSATEPIISKHSFLNTNKKTLIDLSVPNNIHENVTEIEGVSLVNVDDLSIIKDETLQTREAEKPKAYAIIAEYMTEFTDWVSTRRYAPVIRAAKQKLQNMSSCQMFLAVPQAQYIIHNKTAIPKTVKKMAVKLKEKPEPGCDFIALVNDYLAAY